MSHRLGTTNAVLLSLAALGGLVTTACPLSDKYYIEQNSGGTVAGQKGATSSAGRSSTGAGSGMSGAGRGGFAGQGGDQGPADAGGVGGDTSQLVAGSAGASSEVLPCDNGTCTGTCCNRVCVDLSSDANNCGKCGNACPVGRSCRGTTCYGWTAMALPPSEFVAREKAAYTVADSKLFVFGGIDDAGNALSDGALYDPVTDSWTVITTLDNAPSSRQLATAIWSGLRVFVVGGRAATSALAYSDGGRYTLSSGAWIGVGPLPVQRVAPFGAAGPDFVLVWGGLSASGTALSGGERFPFTYGSSSGTWTSISTTMSTPERATDSAWATATDSAFLFGGRINGTTKTARGFTYTFAQNSWTLLAAGPTARWGAFATNDGTAYFLWGGRDETVAMNDGYRYSASWTGMTGAAAPSPRWAPHRRTGWAFALGTGDIVVVGGLDFAGNPLTDGGRYNRATDSWTAVAPWNSEEAHDYGVAATLSGEVYVWGGRNGAVLTRTGERYLP